MQSAASRHEPSSERAGVALGCCNGLLSGDPSQSGARRAIDVVPIGAQASLSHTCCTFPRTSRSRREQRREPRIVPRVRLTILPFSGGAKPRPPQRLVGRRHRVAERRSQPKAEQHPHPKEIHRAGPAS